jgi:hypothetical protein
MRARPGRTIGLVGGLLVLAVGVAAQRPAPPGAAAGVDGAR